MTAFDTDVLTEILLGNSAHVQRAASIRPDQQAVPLIVERAYELLERTLVDFYRFKVLPYTSDARGALSAMA